MRAPGKLNVPVFEITIVAALVLIGWAAYRLYKIVPEVDESRHQLVLLRNEFLQLGDFVQTNITELDESLGEFVMTKNAEARVMFEKRTEECEKWLSQKREHLLQTEKEVDQDSSDATAAERIQHELLPVLDNIQMPYSNYIKAARYIIRNTGQPLIKELLAARDQTTQRSKTRLLSFARQAHQRADALDLVLASSRAQFGSLANRIERLRVGLLLAIVALCLLLAAVLYRRMVAQAQLLLREQEFKRLEQQVRLDKLTHFGQLAQELAHEIKQPLTAINAHLYALQKTMLPTAEPNKDIAVIDLEISRLDRIVRDFLELARPAEPAPVPLQAGKTLEEVRELMASQFDPDSIAFKCECDQEIQFLADPQQLKQVLINLVKNAAECLGKHGTVTMRAKRGTRQFNSRPAEAAILEVEDTGPGIPPEIKEKIFDPFFSTKEAGSGLGLAIAARIIDKHGGRLEFESEVGKGTVFRIALPACGNGQPA